MSTLTDYTTYLEQAETIARSSWSRRKQERKRSMRYFIEALLFGLPKAEDRAIERAMSRSRAYTRAIEQGKVTQRWQPYTGACTAVTLNQILDAEASIRKAA